MSVGHLANPFIELDPKTGAERRNAIQKYIIENTRLGIPVIIHGEGLHGFMAKNGTSFSAIGLRVHGIPNLTGRFLQPPQRNAGKRHHTGTFATHGHAATRDGEEPRKSARILILSLRWVWRVSADYREKALLWIKPCCIDSKHLLLQPAERGINYSPGNYSER